MRHTLFNDTAHTVPICWFPNPPGDDTQRKPWADRGRLDGCTAPCRGRLAVDPPASATEPFVEWAQLPEWIVGADSIRPQHKAPPSGCSVPGRLLVDPYSWHVPFNRVLSKIRGFGRMLSAPTVSPNCPTTLAGRESGAGYPSAPLPRPCCGHPLP